MAELLNVPGEPEVWKVGKIKADGTQGGTVYLVYTVPNSKPPVYIRWEFASLADVQAKFGPDQKIVVDKRLEPEEAKQLGMLDMGDVAELANFDGDPFTTWTQTMETEAAVAPWIMDDDYQALLLETVFEGRIPTDAEIQQTEWWQNNNEDQREWMKLWNGDQETAISRREDNRLRTREQLLDAGVQNPSDGLVNYLADQVTKGNWSTTYFLDQIQAVSDPYSDAELNGNVASLMGPDTGTTQSKEDTVRSLLNKWLGPVYGNWSQDEIAAAAGKIRNDPDGELDFVENLKGQRLAMFPGYEDENLSYQDIATPWRNFATQSWGQTVDETDSMFAQLLKNNDATKNGSLLRTEGVKRNIGKVVNDANSSAMQVGTGLVRSPE